MNDMRMPGSRLLLVEPDRRVRDELRRRLQDHAFVVTTVQSIDATLPSAERERPAVIVMRHPADGVGALMVLQRMRAARIDIPIIVIGGSDRASDKILALDLGADDYLVDPADPRELVARLRNVMRRSRVPDPVLPLRRDRFQFGDYEVDLPGRRLLRLGSPVKLRASEFALLRVFVEHPLTPLSRPRIASLLGSAHLDSAERRIDTTVCRLRSVLGESVSGGHAIQTLRAYGYIFVPEDRDVTSMPAGFAGEAG